MKSNLIARRYHVWPGNNVFCCYGRVILGPGIYACAGTLLLILVPSIVFFFKTCPILLYHQDSVVWVVLAAILVVLLLYFFFRTAVCDPGIIPRRDGWYLDSRLQRLVPSAQGVVVNGRVMTLKYCTTCNIYRPPRCSHCKICDNCVDRFDHHCPWVGNCIGRRNYRWFLLFTFDSAIYAIYVFFLCIRALYLAGLEAAPYDVIAAFITGAKTNPSTVSIAIVCILSLFFTGALSTFHIYLLSANITTNEHMKGVFGDSESFYTKGCQENWLETIFDPVPESLVDAAESVVCEHHGEEGSSMLALAQTAELRMIATEAGPAGGDQAEPYENPLLNRLPRM
uniref:Palmitoyltransferase n=1 Tax=Hanusia phi TaxID=3032 RepID=A0A7S0ET38_9CRYP|mmetsp:Transcript_30159/g.68243  ORF Transcript_30159/g.68243 Transcript_30159/m.68243 type:complete len:340 (+) Transcript_30159:168-1187(+)